MGSCVRREGFADKVSALASTWESFRRRVVDISSSRERIFARRDIGILTKIHDAAQYLHAHKRRNFAKPQVSAPPTSPNNVAKETNHTNTNEDHDNCKDCPFCKLKNNINLMTGKSIGGKTTALWQVGLRPNSLPTPDFISVKLTNGAYWNRGPGPARRGMLRLSKE